MLDDGNPANHCKRWWNHEMQIKKKKSENCKQLDSQNGKIWCIATLNIVLCIGRVLTMSSHKSYTLDIIRLFYIKIMASNFKQCIHTQNKVRTFCAKKKQNQEPNQINTKFNIMKIEMLTKNKIAIFVVGVDVFV